MTFIKSYTASAVPLHSKSTKQKLKPHTAIKWPFHSALVTSSFCWLIGFECEILSEFTFPNICIHSANTSVQRTWLVKSTFLTFFTLLISESTKWREELKTVAPNWPLFDRAPLLLLSLFFFFLKFLSESVCVLWKMTCLLGIWESICLKHWNQKAAGLFWASSD